MAKRKLRRKDSEWYKFQEEICEHFKNLGAKAETNVTVPGPTATYDIDVLVTSKYLGTDFTWIIEAKHWNSPVTIEKVNALTTVVKNTGADRGFIISKSGFQRGAINASKFNNITLLTFDELKSRTEHLIQFETIKMHFNRLTILSARYWGHAKRIRRDYDLRGDIGDIKIYFSGSLLMNTMCEIFKKDTISYPLHLAPLMEDSVGNECINNFNELNNWLHLNLNHLDRKIFEAEMKMIKNGDFHPKYKYTTLDIIRMFSSDGGRRLIEGSFLPQEIIEELKAVNESLSKKIMLSGFFIPVNETSAPADDKESGNKQ